MNSKQIAEHAALQRQATIRNAQAFRKDSTTFVLLSHYKPEVLAVPETLEVPATDTTPAIPAKPAIDYKPAEPTVYLTEHHFYTTKLGDRKPSISSAKKAMRKFRCVVLQPGEKLPTNI